MKNKLSDYVDTPSTMVDPSLRVSGGTDLRSYLNPSGGSDLVSSRRVEDYQSYWDKNQVPLSSPFVDDMRAQLQSRADKWANGVTRMAATALTTFTESLLDPVVGIPLAIATGDTSKIYDNKMTEVFDSLNDFMREQFPIHATEAYQDYSLGQRLGTANFWAEDFTQGIGFMAGAVAAVAATAAMGNITGFSKLAQQVYGSLSKGIRTGKGAMPAFSTQARATREALEASAKGQIWGKQFMANTAALIAATGESAIEARGIRQNVIENLQAQVAAGDLDLTDEEIVSLANEAGNIGFAVNLALVGGSNVVQFGRLAQGLVGIEEVLKGTTSMVGSRLAAKAVGRQIVPKAVQYGWAALKNPLTEFGQETGQFITEKAMESVYADFYDPKGVANVNDYIEGLYRGIHETFGTTEGQTSMFLGALLGAIGVPGVGGGVVSDIQEVGKQQAANQKVAELINNSSLAQKFRSLHAAAVFNSTAGAKEGDSPNVAANRGLESSDPFTVMNTEMDELKNYLLNMAKAGRLDIVEEHLQGLIEAAEDPDVLAPDGTVSSWEQATGTKVKPETFQSFVKFVREGMRQAERIVEETQSLDQISPELGLLMQQLMFNEYKADALADKAEQAINEVFSKHGFTFSRSQVFERDETGKLTNNPAEALAALVKKLKATYGLNPLDQAKLEAARGILLGAEGQKELVKAAYDHISAMRDDNYAPLVKELRAKKRLFDQRARAAKLTKSLVDAMDTWDPELKALYEQNIDTQDGEFFSSEFDIVVPASDNSQTEFKMWEELPKERRERLERENQEDIDAGREPRHKLDEDRPQKEDTRMRARFTPTGDIVAFNPASGREITFKRGPRAYQMIDRSTIRPVAEVIASTHSARLSAQIKTMGSILTRQINDATAKTKEIKAELRRLRKLLQQIQAIKGRKVNEDLREEIGTALKKKAEIAKFLTEQIALREQDYAELTEVIEELSEEREILREEYKLLKASPMSTQQYEKRIDSLDSDAAKLAEQADGLRRAIASMRSLLREINAFLRKAAKITDPDILAQETETFKAFLENKYELLMPLDLDYFNTFELKNRIAAMEQEAALAEKEVARLDQLEPVIRAVLMRYKKARALDKRRDNAIRNKKQKIKDDLKRFSKDNPTTEIANQHKIFEGETEAPKGSIAEVFSSTTGFFGSESVHSKAWFKFTSEVTPEELENMRLVPVTAEVNKFESFFQEHGIEFYDAQDIKLVLVDAEGNPVMRYGQPLYSSMPLARANWLNSTEKRFREVSPAEELQALEEHSQRRAKIVEKLKAGKDVSFRILGKRRGVPVLDPAYDGKLSPSQREAFAVDPHKSVVGTMVADEAGIDELVIGVASDVAPGTRGVQTVETGEQATLRAGAVYAVFNGSLVPLIKRRLTRSEAATIVNILRFHASEYQKNQAIQKDPKATKAEKSASQRKYGTIPGTKVKAKEYLKSILAFDNYNEQEAFNIYFTNQNTLVFGKEEVDLNLLLEGDIDTMDAVEQFLLKKFHHVSKEQLKSKKAFLSVEMDENFKTRTTEHKSYKHYLVSPNGRSQNQVPLGTWLVDASDAVDSVQYKSVNLLMDYGSELSTTKPAASPIVVQAPVVEIEISDSDPTITADAAQAAIDAAEAALSAAESEQAAKKAEAPAAAQAPTATTRESKISAIMKSGVAMNQAELEALSNEEIDQIHGAITQVDYLGEQAVGAKKGYTVVPAESFGDPDEKTAPTKPIDTGDGNPPAPEGLPAEGAVLTKEGVESVQSKFGLGINLFEDNGDGTFTFKGFDMFRLEQEAEEPLELVPAEALQEEFDWFQEAFSAEEKAVVANISREGALGQVTASGKVLIAPTTAAGTLFHEAFHLVSNFYFTAKQQRALWDQWRERTGKKDATDMQAEEGLAEDFRRFAQSGGTILPKYTNRSWLQKLLDFLHKLVGNTRKIESVFAQIYSGGFATKTRARSFTSLSLNKLAQRVDLEEFRRAANLPGGEINEFIDSMNSVFMDSIYYIVSKAPKAFDPIALAEGGVGIPTAGRGTISSTEFIYERVRAGYLSSLARLSEKAQAFARKEPGAYITREEISLMKILKALVSDNWESTKLLHQEHFEQTGFFLDSRDMDLVLDAETGETIEDYREEDKIESKMPDWVDSVEIDPTKVIAREVKFLLFGIPKRYLGRNEKQSNRIGLAKSAGVRELVLYLQNHLAEEMTFSEMMTKMRQLARIRPEINNIMERMGVPTSGDVFTRQDLEPHFKLLQDAFFRQFSRARYDFEMLVKSREGELTLFDSAAERNETRIVQEWKNRLNFMIAKNSALTKVTTRGRVLNAEFKVALSNNKSKSFKELTLNQHVKDLSHHDKMTVLEHLGITFDAPDLVNPTVINQNFDFIMKHVATEPSASSLFRRARKKDNEATGVYNRIQKNLAAEAVRVSDGIIDIMFQTPGGRTIFGISDYNYLHNVVGKLNKNEMPEHLNKETNPFLSHSRWLVSGVANKLKVKLLSGFKNLNNGSGKDASKTTAGTLMATYFHSVLNRRIPIPRTSDKKLMYSVQVPEEAWFKGTDEAAFVDYMMDVLEMELNTWMLAEGEQAIGSEIEYMENNLKGLRLFKSIVPEGLAPQSPQDIAEYLEENRGRVTEWVRNQVKMTGEELKKYNLVREDKNMIVTEVVPSTREGSQAVQSKTMPKAKWSEYLHEFTYNYLAGTIEATGMLYGDLAQFKNFQDFFKRTSGAIGTKAMPRIDAENLAWLNANRPRRDGFERDGTFKAFSFDDVMITSALFDELNKLHPGKYKGLNEADAQGWVSMDGYRDFHLFNRSWTTKMEKAFQRIVKGESLSTDEMGLFGPIKPMYFGPQQNTSAPTNTYLKTSLMPLVPDLLNSVEGKRLLASMEQDMFDKQVDVTIMKSGNKVGRKLAFENDERVSQSLYTEDNQYNPMSPGGVMVLSWEYFGEQVKVDPHVDARVNFGTQVRKLIWANMFSNGAAKSITWNGNKVSGENILTLYNQYNQQIEEFLNLDKTKLLEELGIKESESGGYEFVSYAKTAKLIEKEMIRQNYNPDVIAGMREMFSNPNLPKKIDLLPNKREVENLLMSLVKNRVMRQKMPGSMRVLVANTGFEVERGNIQSSNDLAFYKSDGKGNTTHAEIKVPLPKAWIKPIYAMTGSKPTARFEEVLGLFNKMIADGKVSEDLLTRVGYRIPNHGLPATDALIVKEFLHPAVGNIVIMPSEIVEKAGSDYDIDKLTVFDKNVRVNDKGELEFITDGREGAENQMMKLMEIIMLAPENYAALTKPTDPTQLSDLATKVRNLKNIKKDLAGGLDTLSFLNMIRVSRSLWAGKDGVGITATHTTSHSLSQAVDLQMNNVSLPFEGFEDTITGKQASISLGSETAINGENIINNIGMFLNAFVDVSKDDFVIDINATPDTANIYFFLLRAGVPLQTAVYFMNQPVINEYLLKLQTLRSEILQGELTNPSDKKSKINKTLTEIQGSILYSLGIQEGQEMPTLTEAKLYQAMESNDMSSRDGKIFQAAVFLNFLQISEYADALGDLVRVSNFDTNFAKSMREPLAREAKIERLKTKDQFKNLDAYLDNTPIGAFRKTARESSEFYKNLFLSATPQVQQALSQILAVIEQNSDFYSVTAEDTARAYKAVEDDFTTFLLLTMKVDGAKVSDRIASMMTGKDSLPARLQLASRRPELQNNYFLKKIIPELSEFQSGVQMKPDTLRPFSNKFNNAETTALIDGIREINEIQPQLAEDLIDFFIMQAGMGFSPRSLVRAIPFDLFLPRASRVIENFYNGDISKTVSYFPTEFIKNNGHLNGVVPDRGYNQMGNHVEISMKIREGLSPLPYIANWIKIHEGESGVYHRGVYKLVTAEKGYAKYQRLYELGDSMMLREYYGEERASVIPANNPIKKANSPASEAQDNPAPEKQSEPAKPTKKESTAADNILEAMGSKLSGPQLAWFMKHHGTEAIVDHLKLGGTSAKDQEKTVNSLVEMTKLNCKK
jgi:hypothetical protein